ncbi:hypothetical protein DFR28_106115 [Arenicella xantha]|uniref:Uncharacterized protein n=1 Tax=Arenicella xantha TaxID=644221 RepID=A0A395JG20_9GAMM|nr:hypothetical protein DFR28_106115 [Arenicella xantha]
MSARANYNNLVSFLLMVPLMAVLYAISVYLIEDTIWFCIASFFFIGFSAEHIYNFIVRANNPNLERYLSSSFWRIFALGVPFTLSLISWCIANAL